MAQKKTPSEKKIAQIYLQDLQLFASLTTPRREIEKAGVRCAAEREKDITGGNQTFHIFLGPFKAILGIGDLYAKITGKAIQR